ncbi:transcriptional regulator [Pullulanibacillus camelliae]|uniref:Transcriptional regulator n=1 Tax=Pullulanibacillus camelliae TaxID=1707096 RepID=A0A8J2YG66_9BACL|nr:GntR family transcriptional regulator [Pullulanibacillus camelliae]GGE33020.1 transcriptional regulator [Pullulanibacillus camelliae]
MTSQKNNAIYLQISNDLKEKILNNVYEVGDKLPTENDLMEAYNVSRVTARKALETLVQQNFIVRHPGRGSYVTENKNTTVSDGTISNDTPLIGVILPEVTPCFGTQILPEIGKELKKNGLHLIYSGTEDNQYHEAIAIKEIRNLPISGLIIWPASGKYIGEEILKLVIDKVPVVLLDRYIQDIETNYVISDNNAATKEALNYLLTLGHQKIGICSKSPEFDSSIKERVSTAANLLSEKGASFNPNEDIILVSENAFQNSESIEAEREAMKQHVQNYLSQHPETTAFFVTEYYPATLLYQVLNALNYRIPEDISILCYDSPEFKLEQVVKFTHVQQNEKHLAQKAVSLLLDSINNKVKNASFLIDASLVIGDTTAKPSLKS